MATVKRMDTSKPSVPLPRSKKGLKGFWTDVVKELKKVDWPPMKEVHRLTGVVLAVCLMLVAVLYGLSLIAESVIGIITKG